MMCEFHDSNGNGFGDIWWADKLTYFSSIDRLTMVAFTYNVQVVPCSTALP